MRSIIATAFALIMSIGYLSAQDVIICRNGDEITSKVLKISKTEIEYKKWNNQDGPTYTLEKAEVFMIKYQNGDKDVFKETPAAPAQASNEQAANSNEQTADAPSEPILATPAANNAELIASYNNDGYKYIPRYPDKKINKPAKRIIATLGVTSCSILSTDDIEISLLPIQHEIPNASGHDRIFPEGIECDILYEIEEESIGEIHRGYFTVCSDLKFAIMIKNKTSRPIYIDKAACFGNYSSGKTRRYYDQQEYTLTEGGSSGTGASINLGSVANALGVGGAVGALAGGVNVGGNNENFGTVSRIYKMERLLKIPAHSSVALSEDNGEELPSNSRNPLFLITGAYEDFALPKLSLNIDEEIEFTENNTPKKNDYTITYSFNQELTNCFVVKFGVYLKDAFGVKERSNECHNRIKLSPKTIPIVKNVEKRSIFQY